MTDINALIEKLEKLDAERTQGEWRIGSTPINVSCKNVTICSMAGSTASKEADFYREQLTNTAFITTLANEALPALKAAQDRIKVLEEALEGLCSHWDELLNNMDCGPEYEAREAARSALKGETND